VRRVLVPGAGSVDAAACSGLRLGDDDDSPELDGREPILRPDCFRSTRKRECKVSVFLPLTHSRALLLIKVICLSPTHIHTT